MDPFNGGGVKRKENVRLADASRSDGQDMFNHIQQLFEDLRKVKVKIEDHLHTASDVPFSKNTNEIMHKLDEIRAEYSNILSTVEKSQKEDKCIKENLESFNNNDKPETTLDDSTSDPNIRNLNLNNINDKITIGQPKATLIYQLKTETTGHADDPKIESDLNVKDSRVKLHQTRSEITEETTKTTRTSSEYQTETIYKRNKAFNKNEEHQTVFERERSASTPGNIVNLEAENKTLKKHIITLQEDLLSLQSDSPPPLAITNRNDSPQEWKESKPYSKNKPKTTRMKSYKYGRKPGVSNRVSHPELKYKSQVYSPGAGHIIDHRSGMNITSSKTKTFNEEIYTDDDDEYGNSDVVPLPSNSALTKRMGPVKHSFTKVIQTRQENKSIMSIITNDDAQTSKMNLALKRSSTPDNIKKKMNLKEKEIQALKDALQAAEKNSYKEANRLRTAKLSDVDISEKLLNKSYECDELLEENIRLRKTIDQMGIEIRDLELAILQLKNAKGSLEILKEKNTEENADLLNRLQIVQDELDKCREISDLKDRLSDELAKVMLELNECKEINKEQKSKLNSFKKDKECKTTEFEKKIDSLKKQNQECISQQKELEERNKFLEKKNDELKKSYEKKLAEQADRLKIVESKASKLEDKLPGFDIQRELEELKRANKILQEDIMRLREQNTNLQYEKVEITKQKDRCEQVLNTIAIENDSLKNDRMLRDCNYRDLDNELALLKSEKNRLEHLINSTNDRVLEINENKNLLIDRLNEVEQQKTNLLQDLDLANQELLRLRNENYQLDLKYQQVLIEKPDKCLKNDDDSSDVSVQASSHSATGISKLCSPPCVPATPACSPAGSPNARGYEFTINNGIRRGKFHGPVPNKQAVENSGQVFAIAIPSTEGDSRPKVECKKRFTQRKKC